MTRPLVVIITVLTALTITAWADEDWHTRIHGRVLDQEGNHVVGAEVSLSRGNMWHESNPVSVTDETGQYQILLSGRRFGTMGHVWAIVLARHERMVFFQGHLRSDQSEPRGDGREDLEFDIVMESAGPLFGTVVWPDGEPVSGARIRVRMGMEHTEGQADENGNFHLRWVNDHDLNVTAAPPTGEYEWMGRSDFTDSPLRLVLTERGGSIRGRTVGMHTGQPLPGIPLRLEWLGPSVVTDGEGRFEMHDLRLGERELAYNLNPSRPSEFQHIITLTESAPHWEGDLSFPEPIAVAGTITDIFSGVPIGDCTLGIRTPFGYAWTSSNASGEFQFDPVPIADTYTLENRSGEPDPDWSGVPQTVDDIAELQNLSLVISGHIDRRYRLIGPSGQPQQDQGVHFHFDNVFHAYFVAQTDEEGYASAMRVPTTARTVRAWAAADNGNWLVSALASAEADTLLLQEVPWGSVDILVLNRRGDPLPDTDVRAMICSDDDGPVRWLSGTVQSMRGRSWDVALTDENGRATLELPRLLWELSVHTAHDFMDRETIDLRQGDGEVTMQVSVPRIAGRIVYETGEPLTTGIVTYDQCDREGMGINGIHTDRGLSGLPYGVEQASGGREGNRWTDPDWESRWFGDSMDYDLATGDIQADSFVTDHNAEVLMADDGLDVPYLNSGERRIPEPVWVDNHGDFLIRFNSEAEGLGLLAMAPGLQGHIDPPLPLYPEIVEITMRPVHELQAFTPGLGLGTKVGLWRAGDEDYMFIAEEIRSGGQFLMWQLTPEILENAVEGEILLLTVQGPAAEAPSGEPDGLFARVDLPPLDPARPEIIDLGDLAMQPTYALSGRLALSGCGSLGGAEIRWNGIPPTSARCDHSGAFTLHHLPSGNHELTIHPLGGGSRTVYVTIPCQGEQVFIFKAASAE